MIFLILLLGLIIRLISLNQSFWLDEATSATVIRDLNFSQIITQFSPGDFHPPLYYLLLKVWTLPFGVGEISTRSFSVVCALLSIVIIYFIGKTLKNKFAGLSAALLLATSPLFLYYSQEARMYVLETLLVLAAVFLFIKLLDKTIWWNVLGLSLIFSAIFLTDYLVFLMLPVFWVIAIVSHKRGGRLWLVFILAHIIPILVFIWWSPILIRQLIAGFGVRTSSLAWWQVLGGNSLRELLLVPVKFMIGRISFDSKFVYGLVVFGVSLIFGFAILPALKKFKTYGLIWIWLLTPLVLAFAISFFIPVFSYFRLLFILPAFYLLVSLETRRYLIILVVLNLVFSGIYLFNTKFQREDWRGMSNFITQESQVKKAEVLFVTDGQMEAYKYYNQSVPAFGPSGLNSANNLIWLSRYVQPMFDPDDKLKTEIEQANYRKSGEYDFNGVVVWRYEK